MKKLKTFFHILKNTFTSPKYYRDVLLAPFSFSLKFFVLFFFFYSLIYTAVIYSGMNSGLTFAQKELPDKILKLYPDELEVKVDKGKLTANVPQPYYFSMSRVSTVFPEVSDQNSKLRNLFVIDTQAGLDDFGKFSTFALFNSDRAMFVNRENKYTVYTLEGIDNTVINKDKVFKFKEGITPYIGYLKPLVFSSLFTFFYLFGLFSLLVYLLFFSLIVFLLSKIMTLHISYAKSYQVALHLGVISTVIFGIVSLLKFPVSFPFLRTIILSLLAYVILHTLKSEKHPAKDHKLKIAGRKK